MLKITMIGRRAYQKRMRDGERKFRKALRKQLRVAGKVVQKEIRLQIGERGWSRPAEKTKLRVFVSRFRANATVKPGKKSSKYLGIHEDGATVNRRGRRLKGGGRGKPSTARYKKQPTYRPGTRSAEPQTIRILGRSFRVV